MLIALSYNFKIVSKFVDAFNGFSDIFNCNFLTLTTSDLLKKTQTILLFKKATIFRS